MRFTMSISGRDEVNANLANFLRNFQAASARALYRRMEAVMARSKRQFVPVDLGPLKDSGYVSFPERRGDTLSCTASYGGAAAAYALAVHEHPSSYSPFSWRRAEALGHGVHFSPAGTGPKYLEKPLMQWAQTAAVDLANDIKQETGL